MSNPVDTYLKGVLHPRLRQCSLSAREQQRVVADIGSRLRSLVAAWNKDRYRQVVLFPGLEEASFYEPVSAPLEIRALVVAAVRNSLLEDHHAADIPGVGGDLIQDFTRGAIEYFAQLDLRAAAISLPEPPPGADPFRGLRACFPTAWTAKSRLAAMTVPSEQSELPIPARANPLTRILEHTPATASSDAFVVASGMDATIDARLAGYIQTIARKEIDCFFSPSWKMITRHIRKLFIVLDYVLAHQGAVVTANYLVEPGLLQQRRPLVKPVHTVAEIPVQLADLTGLQPRHALYLFQVREQVS
jgi:hypothetical protein